MEAAALIGLGRGSQGVFIAPPGFDAFTATNDQLTVNLTQAVSQLVMIGFVPVGVTLVPLGFTRPPFVFLNTKQNFNYGSGTIFGSIRPSPCDNESAGATAVMNSNGASMTVTSGSGASFAVYNAAFQ